MSGYAQDWIECRMSDAGKGPGIIMMVRECR